MWCLCAPQVSEDDSELEKKPSWVSFFCCTLNSNDIRGGVLASFAFSPPHTSGNLCGVCSELVARMLRSAVGIWS